MSQIKTRLTPDDVEAIAHRQVWISDLTEKYGTCRKGIQRAFERQATPEQKQTRMQLQHEGNRSAACKMSDADVEALAACRKSLAELGREYGCRDSTIVGAFRRQATDEQKQRRQWTLKNDSYNARNAGRKRPEISDHVLAQRTTQQRRRTSIDANGDARPVIMGLGQLISDEEMAQRFAQAQRN